LFQRMLARKVNVVDMMAGEDNGDSIVMSRTDDSPFLKQVQ